VQAERFPLGISFRTCVCWIIKPRAAGFSPIQIYPCILNMIDPAGGVIRFYDIDIDVSNSNTQLMFVGPNETNR